MRAKIDFKTRRKYHSPTPLGQVGFVHRESKSGTFLLRVSILTRDIDIANLFVRLSVRYVPVSDENGLTYRHSFFHRTVAQSL